MSSSASDLTIGSGSNAVFGARIAVYGEKDTPFSL
jgi:hypothetical protein